MNRTLCDSRLKIMASLGLKKEAHSIQVQLNCLRSLANDQFKEIDELEAKLKEARK